MINEKENKDIKFIREFANISVSGVCKDLKIDNSNIYKKYANKKDIKKIKKEIDNRIINLYYNYSMAGDDDEQCKTNTL